MNSPQTLLSYQFPGCAEAMGGVRQKLREVLAGQCKSEAAINNIVLAVGEACMNIIQHAYGEQEKGDIVLEVELEGDPAHMPRSACNLVFRLRDFARQKTCAEQMRSRPLDEIRPGGLGCHIINQVMDEVVLLEQQDCTGNVLQMRKHLAG
jgi:phosphoserine phosphatase RsbU/P